MSPLANLIYKLTNLAWEATPRAAKYASKKTARDLGIHGKLTSTPTGVYRANGQFIPHAGEVFTAPAKYGAMLLGGPGALGATLGAMYTDEMMDRANQVAKDPNSALANLYREDALNEDAMPALEILNTLRDRVGKGSTATPATAPVVAPTTPAVAPNVGVTPKARTSTPRRKASAPVVSASRPGLTEDQIIANEIAMRAGNEQADPFGYTAEDVARMRQFEQEHPAAFNAAAAPANTVAQAPQFGNDDLAVYDWQTGKPRTDIFGFQIRSADPRDHIGDPRWGTITQEMIDNYR